MRNRLVVVISVIALCAALAGCGARKATSDQETPAPSAVSPMPTETLTPPPSPSSDQTLIEQFRAKALADAPAHELLQSMRDMMAGAGPAQADEFIRVMESYYEKNLNEAAERLQAENVQQQLLKLSWPFTEDQLTGIEDKSVRMLVEQTLAGGYKLDTAEGMVFPVVDYGKLLINGEQVSTAMKAYLSLMAMESDARSASDAALVITWDELTKRTLAAESYVMTFPDSPERQKAEDRFIQYLQYYLTGMDNTPIFGTGYKVLPDLKTHYEQTAVAHSGTITGQLTRELLDILNTTGDAVAAKNKNGDEVYVAEYAAFRDSLESKARAALPGS
ncbi:hypothetical protein SD71_11050 [Cohnella kolymensis]|uniref:Lipoprotein n=1 Tax=Cohnella kolymensis TaxID=1590652 RepID=A0ABR5A4D8_9BACL|nr:hypothetical protein [Cohnella kolymensis]KIL35911.1 hypothetical protein SD71_11050 [Cohnella kolymensis]